MSGETRTARDLAHALILQGKGWHDEDGPVVVDGIDPEGMYPVRYHWTSGGAGADSADNFIRNNYLPMEETIRVAIDALTAARNLALEEAARVADERCHPKVCHQDAAARIRALKST